MGSAAGRSVFLTDSRRAAIVQLMREPVEPAGLQRIRQEAGERFTHHNWQRVIGKHMHAVLRAKERGHVESIGQATYQFCAPNAIPG